MADDGMLLNFAIDDSFAKPEPKLKGGTWRDRLSAKKIAQHRKKNPRKPGDSDNNRSETHNPNKVQVGPRAPKRQKTDGDSTLRDDSEPRNAAPQQPRQFISSLFSKNPEPVNTNGASVENNAGNAEDSKPTNAPLIDGIDTFTNLGLAPSLAAHLLTKMELKTPTAIQKASISQLLKEESDAFIQAETGSGKTLAYLLPLVQRIMALSEGATKGLGENGVHRDSGLFAIVLAPTRELCKQISVVLDNLLRCAHWIVSGTVIGGEKKKSEKARLRKGINILVATPGRLADHLENTQALDVSNVRWLVLDEGDRLMDLGFEKDLQEIVKALDARQRPSRIPGVPGKRTTVLCSATLKMNVQKLGEISLKDAEHIQADPADEDEAQKSDKDDSAFKVPAQLKQSYVVVPAKLRLVTLTAFLKRTFMRKGSVMKAIVFTTCADSVDLHYEIFKRRQQTEDEQSDNSDSEDKSNQKPRSTANTISSSPVLSNASNEVKIYKLHGSLPQHTRTSTLTSFSRNQNPSVLICTDVASRGLDLPNVDLVIEYDPAFSADDHLHRIGRTARLGRDGRALIFLLPGCEENYVEILKRGYRDGGKSLARSDANEILKRGFGGNIESANTDWETKTTDWQMDIERWALGNPEALEMARRAFQSHIRAYATHVASERGIFNIKELHLGHLAKSFALRDRPSKVNVPGLRQGAEETKKEFKSERKAGGKKRKADRANGDDDDFVGGATDSAAAAQKMKMKMKEHMAGASEFNLA